METSINGDFQNQMREHLQLADIYNISSNKLAIPHWISVGSRRKELHSGGRVPGLGCVQPAGGGWHTRGQSLLCPEGDLQVRLDAARYSVMQIYISSGQIP